jgi:hypothetical protein
MRIDRGRRRTRENKPQRHYVDHKFHMIWPGNEPGQPRWEVDDRVLYEGFV